MPTIEISSEFDCQFPATVRFPVGSGSGNFTLVEQGGSRKIAAQRDEDHAIAVISGLQANRKVRFKLEAAGGAAGGVELKDTGPTSVLIQLPEGPFTTYNFDPSTARPHFYPVLGPGGKSMTRDYPMKDVAEEKAAKDQDHPHHRSFWTAFDEVNGVNNWAEEKGKHGWTRHKAFTARESGPVFGGFTATATWLSVDQSTSILDEWRRIRVYNAGAEIRLLDYEVRLTAGHGDVSIGDTKEGGILAWRVFHTMKEKEGGRMENSNGGVGEAMCWGKKAAWLDYVGPVSGELLGVAMMDHPGNPNHPCRWHTRSYGLVGSNPFSTKAFEPTAAGTLGHIKAGETMRFRYRVLLHRGNARQAMVDDHYHSWVQAPKAVTV